MMERKRKWKKKD